MSKLKHFLGCIREYKTSTILTILLVVGEAAIEVTIPFITADLINKINGGINMSQVLTTGVILVLLALLSQCFGGLAGFTC